jgi:hypothetical protein
MFKYINIFQNLTVICFCCWPGADRETDSARVEAKDNWFNETSRTARLGRDPPTLPSRIMPYKCKLNSPEGLNKEDK